MAIFISSGLTLSPAVSPNYGIIGYKNYATTTNLSATSETAQNPATNMANPATAYRWEAGDSAYSSDAIVYSGTNLTPSPFDPSGWYGAIDIDLSYAQVTESNPSGETFLGEFEYIGSGSAQVISTPYDLTMSVGEFAYFSILYKQELGIDAIRIFFQYFDGVSISDGSPTIYLSGTAYDSLPSGWETKLTTLDNGFNLLQVKMLANNAADYSCVIYLQNANGRPSIGSKIKVQAAYFGKNTDWPATIQTAGKIPKQVLTINTSGQDIDYIGIARHNLDQQGLTMTVKYDGVEVIPASGVSSKQAIIFLTQLAAPNTVTIEIDGAITAPSIAVLYVGLSIRLQRNIYVGHTPITYGRDRVAINGVSENGQYLGEIVVRETNSTSVNLQNLTPDWYRSTLDPFFALSPRVPCFWAWRPDGYPDEVSYCWVEGNPRPTNQRSNGMMEVSWNFKGVA